jgi:hypothetical protein
VIHNLRVEEPRPQGDSEPDEVSSAQEGVQPVEEPNRRRFGALRGRIRIHDDFDELPAELTDAFVGDRCVTSLRARSHF